MKFRSEVLDVKESPLVQIAMAAETVPNPYRLYYGESDTPTPEFICRAAYEASLAGHTFYTDPSGYEELREAIVEKFRELQGVKYKPSEVTVTVGASQAISLSIRTFIGPGDNAIVVYPAYSIFGATVTLFGGETRPVSLVRDGPRFRLDLDRIREAIDSQTRMLIVNSPSNPTGWVMTRDEQQALWDLAVRHDFVILSDEVYDRLVFNQPVAPSIAQIATDHDHVIVVNSFSKTYNMTGWRLGWAMASERIISLLAKVEEFNTSSPPAMIQRAGIVALHEGEAYVREVREQYASRRKMVMHALASLPRISMPEPEGAFYAFPQVEGLTDSMAYAKKLLQETGVALAPGIAFGPSGEGYLRLCFASSPNVLGPALERLRAFI